MSGAPVELRVGGQTYRVVASAGEEELRRLATIVDARLRAVSPPGRPVSPHALLLAAMSLAHDLGYGQFDWRLNDLASRGAPVPPRTKALVPHGSSPP
jgi:cell division protein ZapA (FtsZ GTPase activity inhibitor)